MQRLMTNPYQPPGTELGPRPGAIGIAGRLRELRSSPGAAWAGPLLIFIVFLLLSSALKTDAARAPWYRAHPEQWVYPVQTLVTLAAVAFWWKRYTFTPLAPRHVAWAVIAGTAGIVLWILPSWLYDRNFVPKNEWLGFTSRSGDGFDPTMWADNPAAYWTAVTMRFIRMTIAVAFAEELFWRGFLWRAVADPYRDFHQVPFGTGNWKALAITVALFTASHMAADRFAAVIWCLIISWLYVRTKSVGACVVAHAISNLILGIYVMVTRQWGFW